MSCEPKHEETTNYYEELIGFGQTGLHPDSLFGFWEFNPWRFDTLHSNYYAKQQFNSKISEDTLWIHNFNLGYFSLTNYKDYLSDTLMSCYVISREVDLYRFDKIEGQAEMPQRFYVKKYPNRLPDGFQYFDFSGFDLYYRVEFVVDASERTELIVQQREYDLYSKVNRLCSKRYWTTEEQIYINTFLHLFSETRLDTVKVTGTICGSSEFTTLVYSDSMYHYSWPVFNYRTHFLSAFLISRLQWYHENGEQQIPMPKLERKHFTGLPVVIEMEGP